MDKMEKSYLKPSPLIMQWSSRKPREKRWEFIFKNLLK
jgi:hypothetical protein